MGLSKNYRKDAAVEYIINIELIKPQIIASRQMFSKTKGDTVC
jgi:hypothetical protein